MKVVILVGGMGTRLSEDTQLRPKPMVEIGGKPILWHIMKLYSYYGFNDFILCLGYKGHMIKEYFHHYLLYQSDLTIKEDEIFYHNKRGENWSITMIDTGLTTQTGGRIKRICDYIDGDTFMLTYGDGVANINLQDLVSSHDLNSTLVTMTAIQQPGRFGAVETDLTGKATAFAEKPHGTWINGGFFVCDKKAIDYIESDKTSWESVALRNICNDGKLQTYKHFDFWKCMDNLRDKNELEELWNSGNAPWKVWHD